MLAAVASTAWAAPLDAALEPTEEALALLATRAGTLEAAVSAGSGRVDSIQAQERYELGLYHFLVGNYEASAEVFFVLAGRGTLDSSGLQTDAEWYLAESLFQLAFDDMAAEACELVVAQKTHPYREDAVRRLLEVYARSNRPLDFDRVFEQEILRGSVTPSDAILYAVGKSLRLRGERARARGYLSEVTPTGGWSLRARYMLGAMLVEEGGEAAYREAITLFSGVAATDPATVGEEGAVLDLARLALGRLQEQLGEREAAAEAYLAVPEDSVYAPDRTRELGWLYIHAGSWRPALATAQAFLERWPDHAYAAEQRLLLGHLQVQVGAWDAAEGAYHNVVNTYGPVRTALADLARSEDGSTRLLTGLAADGEGLTEVPPVALDMLRAAPRVRKALSMDGEMTLTSSALSASETLVTELADALGPGGGGGAVEGLRMRALEVRLGLVGRRLDALRAESDWLIELGVAAKDAAAANRQREDAQRDLVKLSGRVETAGERFAAGSTVDLDTLEREVGAGLGSVEASVDAATESFRALRAATGMAIDVDPASQRLATLHGRARTTAERLAEAAGALKGLQSTELTRMQSTYAAEAKAVAVHRAAFDELAVVERAAAARLMRDELIALAGRFGERVMGAEMGLMNVAWSQWVESGETEKEISERRRASLMELEARYGALAAPLERAP